MFDLQQGEEKLVGLPLEGNAGAHGGRGGGARGAASKSSKEVIHHHPPKEVATDVGYPMRGGQTLLIAYFPWEASEADIESEFSKFCRVKRVHLVVDKSSRKPRCFGFVKFMSKVDAEEALRATMQGLVQLPDTRGHVWHLKAEWTKSGDMVVDDSETEQEVAKRKEERRYRAEQRSGIGAVTVVENDGRTSPQAKSGKWPTVPLKGALHPGVPAPLPPLQPRYPATGTSLGLQACDNNIQGHLGLVGGMGPPSAPLVAHQGHQQMMPSHQQLPQNQSLTQQVSHWQQGQRVYGGPPPSPPMYGSLAGHQLGAGSVAQQPVPRDTSAGLPSPNQAVGTMPQDAPGLSGAAQAVLREHFSGAASYTSAPQGYAASQPGYMQGQQGYTPPTQGYPQQPHSYAATGYAAAQPPYVPAGHQAYATASQQAYASNQQAYAAGQQTFPQQHSGYAAQPHAYASQQQGSGYGSPPGYSPQAYAGYGLGQQGVTQQGLVQHSVGPQQSVPQPSQVQQGPYGYVQQPGAGPQPAGGAMAYGSYPGGASQAQPLQSQFLVQQADDGSQDSAGVAIAGVPHVVVNHAGQQHYVHGTHPASLPSSGLGGQSTPPQLAVGDLAATPPDGATAASAPMSQSVTVAGANAQYLDMVWQLSEMSLNDKAQPLPAPPSQQPPAPPAGHVPVNQWQAEAFRDAAAASAVAVPAGQADWDVVAQSAMVPGSSAGPIPSAVWNSFDDAAAKGMVDGLVGREDGASPAVTAWSTHSA